MLLPTARAHTSHLYIYFRAFNEPKNKTARKWENEKARRSQEQQEHWIRSKPQQCIIHVKLLSKNPFCCFFASSSSPRVFEMLSQAEMMVALVEKKGKKNSRTQHKRTMCFEWNNGDKILFFQNITIIFLFLTLISQAVQQLTAAAEANPSTNNMKWVRRTRRRRRTKKQSKREGKNNNQIIIILCSVPYYIIQETV